MNRVSQVGERRGATRYWKGPGNDAFLPGPPFTSLRLCRTLALAFERLASIKHGLIRGLMIQASSSALIDQGADMRHTFMSIDKAFGTYSEGMTRVAERAEPWNPGACRRR